MSATPGGPPYSPTFAAVLAYEMEQVRARREAVLKESPRLGVGGDKDEPHVRREAQKLDLFGLALSGGGIRSGTFALGVLQALASLGLLKRLDYISSVSGGGYIHAWLAAWIRREVGKNDPQGNPVPAVENVSRQLAPSRVTQATAGRPEFDPAAIRDDEPAPVRHLREYSRYLAPRGGQFSLDRWALAALYMRNLLANGPLFFAAAAVLSLVCRLLLLAFNAGRLPDASAWAFLLLLVLFPLGLSQLAFRVMLAGVRANARVPAGTPPPASRPTYAAARYDVFGWLVLPCLVAFTAALWQLGPAVGAGAGVSRMPDQLRFEGAGSWLTEWLPDWDPAARGYTLFAALFGLFGLGMGAAGLALEWAWFRLIRRVMSGDPVTWRRVRRCGWELTGAFAFGAVFGLGVSGVVLGLGFASPLNRGDAAGSVPLLVAFGPALLFVVLAAGAFLETVFTRRYMSDTEVEWRSRASAVLLLTAVLWAAGFTATIYLPRGVEVLAAYVQAKSTVGWWLAAAGWVASGLATYLLRPQSGRLPNRVVRWALLILPVVFLVGLVAACSVATHSLYMVAGPRPSASDFLAEAASGQWGWVSVWLGGTIVVGCLYAYLIEPNLFSLHAVYSNRLIRGYLAASRPRSAGVGPGGAPSGADEPHRLADVFTGFHHLDDLSLGWFQVNPAGFPPPAPGECREGWRGEAEPYLGPYPLFNTTLNLVAGTDLAHQDRKGESFFLSPGYSGSNATGFARFLPADAAAADNLTIGRAMAISGAAVDPNMQNFQSAGLTALLALLNLRLGWWLRRPQADWAADTPWSAAYLLKEAIGDTRADGEFVHLSDGGHFDNTGGYELIRRRCRFVVLVDAAEDPNDASENLANLIRLVRTDFGIRIELDTSPLRWGGDGFTTAHAVVGLIRYDDVDPGAVNGTLLFVRSSLTGDEPADLLNYAATNPPFPHHSTADQFFDEPQFESYRALGHHIGMAVFGPPKSEVDQQWRRSDEDIAGRRYWYTRRLFSEVRRQWAVLPPRLIDSYHKSVGDWLRIEQAMRTDPRLGRLTADVYRELGQSLTPATATAARPEADLTRSAEIRAMGEMVQMMETAYMRMELDHTFSHPVQRGWMNCLRRYTAAEAFHEYWPVLRPLFSYGFARFCERTLNVPPLTAELVHCPTGQEPPLADHRAVLAAEFGREWASVLDDSYPDWNTHYLDRVLSEAVEVDGRRLIWLFRYAGRSVATPMPPSPIGLAAVRKWVPQDPKDDSGGQGYCELVFWVRGGYRSAGVGRDCLRLVMQQLIDAGDPHRLVIPDAKFVFARFPRTGGSAADSLHRAVWTTFFNDHDFAAYRLPPEVAQWEVRVRYPATVG